MTPHSQGLQATHWGWEGLAGQPDEAHNTTPDVEQRPHCSRYVDGWMEESEHGGRTLRPGLWLGPVIGSCSEEHEVRTW